MSKGDTQDIWYPDQQWRHGLLSPEHACWFPLWPSEDHWYQWGDCWWPKSQEGWWRQDWLWQHYKGKNKYIINCIAAHQSITFENNKRTLLLFLFDFWCPCACALVLLLCESVCRTRSIISLGGLGNTRLPLLQQTFQPQHSSHRHSNTGRRAGTCSWEVSSKDWFSLP